MEISWNNYTNGEFCISPAILKETIWNKSNERPPTVNSSLFLDNMLKVWDKCQKTVVPDVSPLMSFF